MDTRSVYVIIAIVAISAVIFFSGPIANAHAKTVKVKVTLDVAKPCRDIGYIRMADNTRDPVTGEHKGLIWKTPYFTMTKTHYSFDVKVDPKKAPSGRIVTYDEIYDGLPNGKTYNSKTHPPTEELHDLYIHSNLGKGLKVNFKIPALC